VGFSNGSSKRKRSIAVLFVVLMGVVGLLSDVATEGTRCVTGPFLGLLGASAIIVSLVAGLSELVGYSLRIVFGWLVDRTGNYWAPVIIGYAINLVAVPALALAGDWFAAVTLIMLERMGRAIRGPARDAMLSYASKDVGRGWTFGVQEALSSVGGMIGPAILVAVMALGGDYRLGFEVLLVPALLALVLAIHAWQVNPRPRELEGSCPPAERKRPLPRLFWAYILAGALIAAGYADFPLIALHMGTFAGVSDGWIPVMYAIVMASDGLSALVFGRTYDHIGLLPLVVMSAVVPLFVPLLFSSDIAIVIVGLLLYGVGFGAQESVMRAVVADMTPHCRRGSAFGTYNAVFGASWFLGSLTMGVLYDLSIVALMFFSMALQLAAIPVLVHVMRDRALVPYGRKKEAEADG